MAAERWRKRKLSDASVNKGFCSFRLLLLLAIGAGIIQILVGIFFLLSKPIKNQEKKVVKTKLNQESTASRMSKLSADNLGILIRCEITGMDALSALRRATSKECKQAIVDLVCDLNENLVYPVSLTSNCPTMIDSSAHGVSLGCYQDSQEKRLLQGDMVPLKTTNSPSVCIELCSKRGFAYAGLQWGQECFCGNILANVSALIPDSSCDMPCTGNPSIKCGGFFTMQIYTTGSKPTRPDISSRSSEPVRIVFLITVAGRAVRQVRRMIKAIYSKQHYFLIHVDNRQDYMFREMEAMASILPNMRLVSKRYATIWGGASLLQMLLSSMEELLTMSDWTWDFVLNLSESDYPISTNAELAKYLGAYKEFNFVKSHGKDAQSFIRKQGLDKTFFQCENRMWKIAERKLPTGILIDGGSDWICLNKIFVEYVIHSQEELVLGLKKIFKYSLLPAETFFHTVIRNSKFCGSYVDNNLHITNWKRKLGCKCQYKHIVDWCGCSPNDFLLADWPRLKNSASHLFFARKFEPIIHQGIVNKVDAKLGKIDSSTNTDNLEQYWQNNYHHMDLSPAPDKHTLTALNSLAQKYMKEVIKSCQKELSFIKVKEMTSYHYKDSYNASLILAEVADANDEQFEVELKVLRKSTLKLTHSRIIGMNVSSIFDPKELVLRNTFGALGPDSKVFLKLSFKSGTVNKTNKARFLWVDPVGVLTCISKIQLNDTGGAEGTQYTNSTMRPGVWSIVALLDSRQVGTLQFLIIPDPNKPFNPKSEAVSDPIMSQVIINFLNKGNLIDMRLANEAKFGKDREKWTRSLLDKFYHVDDWCVTKGQCGKSCHSTHWSSKYPDPKSSIIHLNKGQQALFTEL